MKSSKRPEPILTTRAGMDRTKDALIDEPSAAERVAAAERANRIRQWAERRRD